MRWRAAGRDDRLIALAWAAGAWGFVCFGRLLAPWAPLASGCPFHEWTGLPCPSCGATRAMLRLASHDWVGALSWNPLGAGAALSLLAGGMVAPFWVDWFETVPCPPARLTRRARIALGLVLAANWLYLILRRV